MNKKAFTLVEVLLATLVIAGLVAVVATSLGGAGRAYNKSKITVTATQLLQRRIAEFEAKYKDKTVDELKEDESGDFGDDYPGFTWSVKTQPFILPPITSQNEDKAQAAIEDLIFKAISQYLEKAVREVLVKVTYKKGKLNFEYTLNSHFIDYTKDMALGL